MALAVLEQLQALGNVVRLSSMSKSRKGVLQKVYYAPVAQYNLLSIQCDCKNGARFEFDTDERGTLHVGSSCEDPTLYMGSEQYNLLAQWTDSRLYCAIGA
jgi:hypothetical protein